jgi:tRNA modification GTPase
VNELNGVELNNEIELLKNQLQTAKLILVGNKIDESNSQSIHNNYPNNQIEFISALEQVNIINLKKVLAEQFEFGNLESSDTIVTNARHANSLKIALDNLQKVKEGVQTSLSGELLAQNIRMAIQALGLITGEVSSDDLLGNIFSKFCNCCC